MEGQKSRPFFLTILSVQYGIAGLGYLAGFLYFISSVIGAGNFGLMVLLNIWPAILIMILVGTYLFFAAKGLYDMKGYGWTLSVIGSVFWVLVSLLIFAGCILMIDPQISVGQPPDIRPMIQQMLAGMPSDVSSMIVEMAQSVAAAAFMGVAVVYYLIKGFFLSNAIYNGIVIAYLFKVRALFRKPPEVKPSEPPRPEGRTA